MHVIQICYCFKETDCNACKSDHNLVQFRRFVCWFRNECDFSLYYLKCRGPDISISGGCILRHAPITFCTIVGRWKGLSNRYYVSVNGFFILVDLRISLYTQ